MLIATNRHAALTHETLGMMVTAVQVGSPRRKPGSSASPQAVADLSEASEEMEGKRLEDAQREAEKVVA